MRVIRYNNKIPRVSVSQFDEVNKDNSCLYCLSDTTVYLARQLLQFFVDWNTIYGELLSNTLFYVSDDSEYLKEYIEKGITELNMACNFDEIASAIRYLADRTAQSGNVSATANVCCNGDIVSGYSIDGNGDLVPMYGTQPGLSLPDTGYPYGYENVEQYRLDKCALSTAMVDNWLSVIDFLSNLNLLNLTALTVLLGATLAELAPVLVFPPAAIPVMIGLLIALGLSMGALTALKGYISSNRSDVICLLYNSNTAEEAIAAVTDFVRNAIQELEILPGIGQIVEVIVMTMINTDTVNKLFIKQGTEDLPPGNCQDCDDDPGLYWLIGSGNLDINGEERVWTSQLYEGNNTQYIRIGHEDCVNKTVKIVSFSGAGTLSWETPFKSCDNDNETSGVVQFNIPYTYGKAAGDDAFFLSLSTGLSTEFSIVVTLG